MHMRLADDAEGEFSAEQEKLQPFGGGQGGCQVVKGLRAIVRVLMA